jgi:hypothetical protein
MGICCVEVLVCEADPCGLVERAGYACSVLPR